MHKATRFLVLILFFSAMVQGISAQKIQKDSTQIKRLNPARAALYSAIVPGMGQIYNHRIWKAAVVYVGFAGITTGFVYNQKEFKSYQKALDLRYDTLSSTVDTKYPDLQDGTVLSLRNYHRRNRDIFILSYVVLYALNIIDANVDAHLREFSINKDLSLKWQPTFDYSSRGGTWAGLNLTFKF